MALVSYEVWQALSALFQAECTDWRIAEARALMMRTNVNRTGNRALSIDGRTLRAPTTWQRFFDEDASWKS